MYYGNVWSICGKPEVMMNITKNIPPTIDDEGNRRITTYTFNSLKQAEDWYFSRIED